MKVIILEDNISYVWEYEMILNDLDIQVTGVYKSWKDALPAIKKELPDFLIVDLFLDNNEKGLDFLKIIKSYFIPAIVCTGYPETQYIDEALDIDVRAFISKPLDKAALKFQIKKLVKEIETSNDRESIILNQNRQLVRVPLKEIYKVEIDGNYSFISICGNKRFAVKLSLTKLMEKLDHDTFLRCHRSTIVNINYVDSLDKLNNLLILSNGEKINVGAKYKASIKKAFS